MQILNDLDLAQVGGGSSELRVELNSPTALDAARIQGWHVGQGAGMMDRITPSWTAFEVTS